MLVAQEVLRKDLWANFLKMALKGRPSAGLFLSTIILQPRRPKSGEVKLLAQGHLLMSKSGLEFIFLDTYYNVISFHYSSMENVCVSTCVHTSQQEYLWNFNHTVILRVFDSPSQLIWPTLEKLLISVSEQFWMSYKRYRKSSAFL